MPIRRVALAATAWTLPTLAAAAPFQPVIDMHVHADASTRTARVETCPGNQTVTYVAVDPATASDRSRTEACEASIQSVLDENELRRRTIAELRRHDVVRAMLLGSPENLDEWRRDARNLFIPATSPANASQAALAALDQMAKNGRIAAIGELGTQYEGYRADDPSLEPFWALADRLDLPVGIHLGEGMPVLGESARKEKYEVGLTSPLQLERVLKVHPRLRLYVMHAASPMTDEMLAMLFTYPTLYVDVSAIDWNTPRPQFYRELQRLVEAGFIERIMFGSDQTIFPQAIGLAIDSIERAPFLTARQKRAILYDNAARFLRLTPAQIAADHRRR